MKATDRRLFSALYCLVFIAIFADFIANEQPILCKIDDTWYAPVLHQYSVDLGINEWEARFVNTPWQEQDYQFCWMPPIPYSAFTQDFKNSRYVGPFEPQNIPTWRYRHWLGTDQIGRDVLAGMVSGTRTALLVGLVAMGIAASIGIMLGAMAGYFGDHRLKISWLEGLFLLVGNTLGFFYAFVGRAHLLSEHFLIESLKSVGLYVTLAVASYVLGSYLTSILHLRKHIYFPMDSLVLRLIELLRSIPAILILLAVLGLIKTPSILYIVLIIGLLSWTGIARFVRSELLRIRQLDYIHAARAVGLSEARILWHHALPNALPPVSITIAFGIAATILVEASLSFLGIGVAPDVVTWGTMLKNAYQQISAWWIGFFPGLAIFCTVFLFNLLGEHLSQNR
ncbi:MAG: ABC transporter permease [Bacteroidota bacterium]